MSGGSPERLRITVLGPVQAWREGIPLDLRPVRRQAVLDLGHYGEAKALLRHAADLAQRVGDVLLHAIILTRLGTAEQGDGNLGTATAL